MKQFLPHILLTILFVIPIDFSMAQEKNGLAPLQLSLFPPLQLQSSDTAIAGLRLGIFAKNVEMSGVGIGVVNWTSEDLVALQWGVFNYTGGTAVGVQWGIANIVNKEFVGWQASAYNWTVGDSIGVQTGAFNGVGNATIGIQFGLCNYSHTITGLQLGILNITENLYGIQIGLLNIATGKDSLPVLPIINASF